MRTMRTMTEFVIDNFISIPLCVRECLRLRISISRNHVFAFTRTRWLDLDFMRKKALLRWIELTNGFPIRRSNEWSNHLGMGQWLSSLFFQWIAQLKFTIFPCNIWFSFHWTRVRDAKVICGRLSRIQTAKQFTRNRLRNLFIKFGGRMHQQHFQDFLGQDESLRFREFRSLFMLLFRLIPHLHV